MGSIEAFYFVINTKMCYIKAYWEVCVLRQTLRISLNPHVSILKYHGEEIDGWGRRGCKCQKEYEENKKRVQRGEEMYSKTKRIKTDWETMWDIFNHD